MLNFINEIVSRFVIFVSDKGSAFLQNISLNQVSFWQIAIDILLVSVLFYWLIRIVQGGRAVNIVLGLIMLALLFLLSQALSLLALGWLLERLLTVILVAIPIIFQQELRRGLEKLGRTKFFLEKEAKEIDFLKSEIIEACYVMAKQHIGGLLVFRREVNLKEYIDTGILLNAKLGKELLLSIFLPRAPLHDGAVIIDGGRIVAAGCVLPHSFKKMPHTFGTRHKAAIAVSEATDADVIVISEQRGTVSFVSDGQILEDIAPEKLAEFLDGTLGRKKRPFNFKRSSL